jgi:hypothetical protein
MVLLPEVQSDLDSTSELDECLLCVNEAEFLALLDNLVAAMRAAPR